MFDITLRPLKDAIFNPVCQYVPISIEPGHVTSAAFLAGLLSCVAVAEGMKGFGLAFWILNRALDCLDGALARHRRVVSDLGGFFDLLGDFVVYSLLPMAVARGYSNTSATWQAVAFLESTFHVNNFILFYVAAMVEKMGSQAKSAERAKHLTSLIMQPAFIEGTESALLFTAMLLDPHRLQILSWIMGGCVCVGIVQRTIWLYRCL